MSAALPPIVRVLEPGELERITWTLYRAQPGDGSIGVPIYNEFGDRIGQLAGWLGEYLG